MSKKLKDTYTVRPDGYLSETTIVEDIVRSEENVVIEAAPGIGKSYALITKLKELGEHFVFAADTTTLADDLASSHGLPAYYKGQAKPNPKESFVTIYDWVHRLPNQKVLNRDNMILVVDEWHSIITYYGFRHEVLSPMVDAFPEFKQVVGLTGTHIAKPSNFDRVKVDQDRDPIEVKHVSYESLWGAIRSEIEYQNSIKHFISLYDKGAKADSLTRELIAAGFDEDKVEHFNADTKNEDDIKSIMYNNLLGKDVDVVISTYTQGFSIDIDEIMVHIAPLPGAKHWVEDIVQVIQRFRKPCRLSVNLYYNFPEKVVSKTFNKRSYYAEQVREAKRQIKGYRKEYRIKKDEPLSDYQKEEIKDGRIIKIRKGNLNSDKINLVNEKLNIEELQIVHNVCKKYSMYSYKSRGTMKERLKSYGIDMTDEYYCHELSIGGSKSSSKKTDSNFEDRVDECLSHKIPSGYGTIAERIKYLSIYFRREKIKEIMMEYGRNTRKWNSLRRKITAQESSSEKDETFRNKIYDKFKVGERYSSRDVMNMMNEINKSDGITAGSKLKKRGAVKRLKDFFEIKRVRVRDLPGGNAYEIVSDTPLEYEIEESACGRKYGKDSLHFKLGWVE